jgi:lipoic acid synthetase
MASQASAPLPKPDWLRVRLPGGPSYLGLKRLMRQQSLHTVCEEAHCPNIGECWEAGTATFMILGDICTRACGFCAVTSGRPEALDLEEPIRVAQAVQSMRLAHAVITAVNRDDVPDGGSLVFANTIRAVRSASPSTTIEVLIPDFVGNWDALGTVMQARPEVLNHNIETVPRLYPVVRPKARYRRSLDLLRRAKELDAGVSTKSGIMLGLGESRDEIEGVLADLRAVACDILTVGQYLRPSPRHLQVDRYYRPEEFDEIADTARRFGFCHVEAGPLVRSSYHAERHVQRMDASASDAGDNLFPLREVRQSPGSV